MFPSDTGPRLVYIPSLADVEIQVEPLAAGVGSPSLWRLGCDEDLYQRGELENGMERHRRDLPEQQDRILGHLGLEVGMPQTTDPVAVRTTV